MARTVTPLTDKKIKTAKPKEKDYKLSDGGGLYLLVTKRNTKLWRLKYRFGGREKLLALGAYPNVPLTKARELREKYKADIANGIDPSEMKKERVEKKKQDEIKKANTFEVIAMRRLDEVENDISQSHYKRMLRGFKNDVFPVIGNKPMDDVEASDIIKILRSMMKRGVRNSAQKVFQSINKTFKWAIANEIAKKNPCAEINVSEIIGKPKETHYPTFTDDTEIKNLLISIKEYGGELSVKNALLMLAYTFVRPSNVRLALWEEIDFKAKQWVIPAKKMKTKDEFIVPLSDSVMALLDEVREYSDDSPYLFPSTKSKTTPLSDGALLGAIRRMGYSKEEFTPHGFRAMLAP